MADALGAIHAAISGAKAAQGVEMLDMGALNAGTAARTPGQAAFSTVLNEAIAQVESFQANSQNAIGDFLAGKDVELHQVALSVQKAETAFELFAEVRNKVVSAYQEVMRMQV